MAQLLDIGIFSIVTTSGAIGVGWKLNFYIAGTSTRKATYPTSANADEGTSANQNPVIVPADGRVPPVWLTTGNYKLILTDENDAVKDTYDPLMPGGVSVSGGYVTPEQFGAVGSSTAPTNSSPNNRQPILDAIAFANANGGEVILSSRYYACRRPSAAGLTIAQAVAQRKFLLYSEQAVAIRSIHPEGTDIVRRDTDGTAMVLTDFDLCDGFVWRGGAMLMAGQLTNPNDPAKHSLTLDGVRFQGGFICTFNHTFPANTTTGDGWDIFDKGIWQLNDQYGGHLTMRNGAGCVGFNGELIYGAGIGSTAISQRNITIDDSCVFGESNGSCFNPNGQTLRVGKCQFYNSSIGIEGWLGEDGHFEARMLNTDGSVIWGGTVNQGAGAYNDFVRPVANVFPLGTVDVHVVDSGNFRLGNAISGRVIAIDTTIELGNGAATPTSKDLNLHIEHWIDQASALAGVSLLGGGPGLMTTARCTIKLDMKRTAVAAAAGRTFSNGVYAFGSYGTDVVVEIGAREGLAGVPLVYAAANTDNQIVIRGHDLPPSTLTYAATVTPDFALARDFEITLTGNVTLANPINLVKGQTGTIYFGQDATGSRIATYGSAWKFPGGAAAGGVLSVGSNTRDQLRYTVLSNNEIYCTLGKAFAS